MQRVLGPHNSPAGAPAPVGLSPRKGFSSPASGDLTSPRTVLAPARPLFSPGAPPKVTPRGSPGKSNLGAESPLIRDIRRLELALVSPPRHVVVSPPRTEGSEALDASLLSPASTGCGSGDGVLGEAGSVGISVHLRAVERTPQLGTVAKLLLSVVAKERVIANLEGVLQQMPRPALQSARALLSARAGPHDKENAPPGLEPATPPRRPEAEGHLFYTARRERAGCGPLNPTEELLEQIASLREEQAGEMNAIVGRWVAAARSQKARAREVRASLAGVLQKARRLRGEREAARELLAALAADFASSVGDAQRALAALPGPSRPRTPRPRRPPARRRPRLGGGGAAGAGLRAAPAPRAGGGPRDAAAAAAAFAAWRALSAHRRRLEAAGARLEAAASRRRLRAALAALRGAAARGRRLRVALARASSAPSASASSAPSPPGASPAPRTPRRRGGAGAVADLEGRLRAACGEREAAEARAERLAAEVAAWRAEAEARLRSLEAARTLATLRRRWRGGGGRPSDHCRGGPSVETSILRIRAMLRGRFPPISPPRAAPADSPDTSLLSAGAPAAPYPRLL
eukprot:tig00000142_g8637.t1